MPNFNHNRKLFESALNQVNQNDYLIESMHGSLHENMQKTNPVLLNEIIGELLAGAAMMAPLAAAAYSKYRRNKEVDRDYQENQRQFNVNTSQRIEDREENTRQQQANRDLTRGEGKANRKLTRGENRRNRRAKRKEGNKNRQQSVSNVILKAALDPNMTPQNLQNAQNIAKNMGFMP
jgi:hypothetical protein